MLNGSTVEHIAQMQEGMAHVMPIVIEHLQDAQEAQSQLFNWSTKLREF